MNTTVHREGNRVWLEGVGGWSIRDKVSSVHAAQHAVMQAIGEEISYEYLIGVSGLAFRMQISKQGFCPSSPHSFCGYRCVARSTEALPWDVRVFAAKPEDKGKPAEARQAIVESINRGVPVQYGTEEDGIIVGYRNNGEEWICYHPLRDGGRSTFVETDWGWGVAVFMGRKGTVRSRRELAITALEQAVTMARAEEAEGYFVGFRAWNEYIQRLKALDDADEQTRMAAMSGNAWIYVCLAQYRACASRYLRDIVIAFDGQVGEHLSDAADLYDEMSRRILRDEPHGAATVAAYPWALHHEEAWTSPARQDQIRRLQAALSLEHQAIGAIEKALALIQNVWQNEPRADGRVALVANA